MNRKGVEELSVACEEVVRRLLNGEGASVWCGKELRVKELSGSI